MGKDVGAAAPPTAIAAAAAAAAQTASLKIYYYLPVGSWARRMNTGGNFHFVLH